MAVTPAVEVRNDAGSDRARYVLENLLPVIGYPYRFVDDWQSPALRVVCGESSDADVSLPEPRGWDASPMVTFLEAAGHADVPILYTGDRPRAATVDGTVTFDLLGGSFELLARREESGLVDGRFPAHRSDLYRLGIQTRPVLNYYALLLRDLFESQLDRSLERVPLWRGDATFAVVLSHDVDHLTDYGWQRARRYLRRTIDSNLSRRQRFEAFLRGLEQVAGSVTGPDDEPVVAGLERTIELENAHGVRSTYFVGALDAPDLAPDGTALAPEPTYTLDTEVTFDGARMSAADLFGHLESSGHEVGLHGSLASCRDDVALVTERDRLEAAVGSRVDGIRQHYLKLSIPGTWKRQADAGFTYDTTLGYNERLGHRAGAAFPYWPWVGDGRRLDLLEVPLTIHDVVFVQAEPQGIDSAAERCRDALREVQRTNGLATVLFHPTIRAPDERTRSLAIYEQLLEFLDDQPVQVGTAGEIATWWRERNERLVDP